MSDTARGLLLNLSFSGGQYREMPKKEWIGVFERNVFDEYKLYCEQRFVLGDFEGFTSGDHHYFFVAVDDVKDEEVKEMIQMANHLRAYGDYEVATFVPTKMNTITGFIDGQNCVMFQLPQYFSRSKKDQSIGYQLALQHQGGKSYPQGKKDYHSWSQFWINRLSQLDVLYADLTKRERKSSFDQAFMLSFPYYLGRTENAIQYIVDSDLDFGKQSGNEPKTICHYKFSPRTWLTIDHETLATVKSPTDFVYDHPSRDLAEWMRQIMNNEENPVSKINQFLTDYESVEPISPKAWRYIYGRLLFPIEYFQIVEGYYRSVNEDEARDYTNQLFDLFQTERQTEQFLRTFHSKVVPSNWQPYVPEVDWLKNFKSTNLRPNQYFFKSDERR